MTPNNLADTIIYGTAADVSAMLREGKIDIDDTDQYGFVPIVEAAIANKVDVAKVLLNHDAQVNQTDVTGRTALHWAADNGNYELCKLLLAHKADPNAFTRGGQPVLTFPLLRGQTQLKNLLYKFDADLDFALDFINTKLLGHRFELSGQVHIKNPKNQFIIVDLEGYFLEFSLAVILDSLKRFKQHYCAKHLRHYFRYVKVITQLMDDASKLIHYRRYTVDIKKEEQRLKKLIHTDILYIPLGYEGHAVSCVKFGNWFVKCDRNPRNEVKDGIEIYEITRPENVTVDFLFDLYFKKLSKQFVQQSLPAHLGLRSITTLPVSWQIAGNCSWANIEAVIPALLFLIECRANPKKRSTEDIKLDALKFYHAWHEWDKDRALYDCLQKYEQADELRQATKATLLAAVLTYGCDPERPADIERARKILRILTKEKHQFILNNYIKVYAKDHKTQAGKNLLKLLEIIKPVDWYY